MTKENELGYEQTFLIKAIRDVLEKLKSGEFEVRSEAFIRIEAVQDYSKCSNFYFDTGRRRYLFEFVVEAEEDEEEEGGEDEQQG